MSLKSFQYFSSFFCLFFTLSRITQIQIYIFFFLTLAWPLRLTENLHTFFFLFFHLFHWLERKTNNKSLRRKEWEEKEVKKKRRKWEWKDRKKEKGEKRKNKIGWKYKKKEEEMFWKKISKRISEKRIRTQGIKIENRK